MPLRAVLALLQHSRSDSSWGLLSGGERLGRLAVISRLHVEWAQRPAFVDVEEGVVTAGEHGGHVVAVTLIGGIVDYPDGAVGSRFEKLVFVLHLREDQ